ncbi:hypothetical protein ABTE17_19860, partial [Acinetobacter baumannii]
SSPARVQGISVDNRGRGARGASQVGIALHDYLKEQQAPTVFWHMRDRILCAPTRAEIASGVR